MLYPADSVCEADCPQLCPEPDDHDSPVPEDWDVLEFQPLLKDVLPDTPWLVLVPFETEWLVACELLHEVLPPLLPVVPLLDPALVVKP